MQSPYLIEHRHMAVKRCKHGLFMYNRNDAFVGRGLDLYGEWCEFEIQLLRLFVRLGDTVIDAGANIGTHTVAFANLVGPGGTVHAFEPQRRNFQMLAGNVALNALENVFCHQKAVGEAASEIRLPPMPPADTHFNFSAVAVSQDAQVGEAVPVTTLDSLDLSTCRLIKLDIEGMEAKALAGARALVGRCRPFLYVENNEPGASKGLAAMFEELGYSAWWSISAYYDPRNFYANTVNVWPNVVPSANLICTPKEAKVTLNGHEPFQGEADDWKAALQRMQERARK